MADLKTVTTYSAPVTISNAALQHIYYSDGAKDLWRQKTPVHDTLKRIAAELARREKEAEKPPEEKERSSTMASSKLQAEPWFYYIASGEKDKDGRYPGVREIDENVLQNVEAANAEQAWYRIGAKHPHVGPEAIILLGPFPGNR